MAEHATDARVRRIAVRQKFQQSIGRPRGLGEVQLPFSRVHNAIVDQQVEESVKEALVDGQRRQLAHARVPRPCLLTLCQAREEPVVHEAGTQLFDEDGQFRDLAEGRDVEPLLGFVGDGRNLTGETGRVACQASDRIVGRVSAC